MSQDYNIYIRSQEKKSIKSDFEPEEETLGGAFKAKDGLAVAKQFGDSGFEGFAKTGIASLAKVAPIVAVAVAVVKVTDKVLTTGFDHLKDYTGAYQYSMEFNNFKTEIGYVLNPIKFALDSFHIANQQDKYNKKQAEYRSTIGERLIGI